MIQKIYRDDQKREDHEHNDCNDKTINTIARIVIFYAIGLLLSLLPKRFISWGFTILFDEITFERNRS